MSPTTQRLQITAASPDPALLDLPWHIPLEDWPAETLAALPRGISRHIVRFAKMSGRVIAVKEIGETVAYREYELLRQLRRLDVPSVEPVGVITGRSDPDGERLEAVLITKHLSFSLPYRTLFAQERHVALWVPLLDALAELLVRIHIVGFFWGDCSLSNTLFRRDAGALSAFVIDMETGAHYPALSDGQRRLDLDIATENVAGGLLDLQMGGRLAADIDPWEVSAQIERRYESLWTELTAPAEFASDETFRIQQRLERLHELGFDVEEMEIVGSPDGDRLRYIPRVVEHGFHSDRLKSLTGLETTENQARRLLADIRAFSRELQHRHAAASARTGVPLRPLPENVLAVRWLDQRFEPLIARVPASLHTKLEAAEIYHQLLEHRWFLSESANAEVPLEEALDSYIIDVLASAPDEMLYFGEPTSELPVIADASARPNPWPPPESP